MVSPGPRNLRPKLSDSRVNTLLGVNNPVPFDGRPGSQSPTRHASTRRHSEQRLIQERTKPGLAAARARGRNVGRPKITAAETKVILAKKLRADKSLEIDDVCQTLRISRSTFYRYVRIE